ncbi:Uncharacterised protein [Escherichia coli]|nr:Uncharacterised protein [Escherichia coli]
MGFPYLAFEKIQIAGCIITRLTNSLHECRFANGVHTADIKVIIMARFDIDTGGYPVQPRAKVAGCGFNLPDIGNPRFRKPELKLYRRVIHRKTRDRCYLKIARCQFNRGGYRRCINPERGGGRFPLLAITVNCPDCQGVFPERQTTETMLCIRSDGGSHQTAVLTASTGQAQTEAHALHHPRRVPFRLCQILTVSRAHLHRQVLHCRWNNAVQGA